MIKLKNILFEASITGQTQSSEELGGYKGFFKLSEMEKYKKWIKKTLRVELVEGVDDPGILKAVFLAGGPGSGKTYIAKGLFGLPDEVFANLTNPSDPKYSGLRSFAKDLTGQRRKLYQNGRLGMIIDGTGDEFNKISMEKKELEAVGYDCYMIFVNTSLDVALERNEKRDRILPEKIVKDSHKAVTQNMGGYQGLFGGSNFMIVDNNKTLDEDAATKRFNMLVKQGIGKFIKTPLKNKRGLSWIRKNKILKGKK